MMKMAFLLTAVVALAAPAHAGQQNIRGGDEAAIRKLYADYDRVWNTGDGKELVKFWAQDAQHVEPDGTVVNGREAIEKALATRLSTDLKGTQSKQTVEAVHFIKPDVALVDASYEVTGAHDGAGNLLPALHGRYLDIWLKRGGRWQIIADRPVAAAHPEK